MLCRTYPLLAPHIDLILPKKSQLDVCKIPDARANLYLLGSTPLFFQHMTDALTPHLLLVHRFPDFFPRVRVDRGAIRFVLSGASLMVPGFTSPGGKLPGGSVPAERQPQALTKEGEDGEEEEELANGAAVGVPIGTDYPTGEDKRYHEQPEFGEGTVVVVEAEGKQLPCAIGAIKMSTQEMKKAKKGIGIEGAHYLGDGLWNMKFD